MYLVLHKYSSDYYRDTSVNGNANAFQLSLECEEDKVDVNKKYYIIKNNLFT
jgi:hypothetical protein